ncbi:hypothetical protein V5F32_00975 [Xanthobacter oligotrophicus]|uniref:Uncharacterized protein n=1 Tax=Xanthobacter oligotrophicus TaxID=2607286 RepID=A0ABW6ZRJ4_9HYPH
MALIIAYRPGVTGPSAIAKMVWSWSQALLQAALEGQRDAVHRIGSWLAATRAHPRCTPALARTIDRALDVAERRLAAPTLPTDGAAA